MSTDLTKEVARLRKAIEMVNRRAGRNLVVVVPPVPIFSYTEKPAEDGKLLGAVFPKSGVLTKLFIALTQISEDESVSFYGVHRTDNAKYEFTFSMDKTPSKDLELEIKEGDVFEVFVDKPEAVKSVMVSVLFQSSKGQEIKVNYNELGIGDERVRGLLNGGN
jgi:hypothetical protein